MKKSKALAVGIAMGATAGSVPMFVAGWEGTRNLPYLDVGGTQTVCTGHTGSDIEPRYYSDEECQRILQRDLATHTTVMLRMIKVPLSEGEMIAYSSFVYNLGVGAFQTSDMLEMLNDGDRKGACAQLLRFVKVRINGVLKVSRGLVNRRKAEHRLCMQQFDRKLA